MHGKISSDEGCIVEDNPNNDDDLDAEKSKPQKPPESEYEEFLVVP